MKALAGLLALAVFLPFAMAMGLVAAIPVAEVEPARRAPRPEAFPPLVEDSPEARPAPAGIPPGYVALYREAGTAYGVDWRILAAIGRVESDHGRNPAAYRPGPAGDQGPMQFIPATWARFKHASGNPYPDVNDPRDSIYAAAAYLKASGIDHSVERALYHYNPSGAYVALVLRWAKRYGYGGGG